MNWLSLLIPIAYLGILVGSLATFSHLYRQRQLNAKLRLAPYFPAHTARNIYLSLMHLPDTDPSNNTKVPDSVLRAALLNRAVEDVKRIMEIRTRKGALNQLLQRGVVGDEIWQRLLRAEQELEVELKDVVGEANALAPGWGQTIFQSASEMAQNMILRENLEKIRSTTDKEIREWENTREAARMELEGETVAEKATSAAAAPAAVASPAVDVGGAQEKIKTVKTASSDEDAVMVETPGEEPVATSTGKNKKKKGKK